MKTYKAFLTVVSLVTLAPLNTFGAVEVANINGRSITIEEFNRLYSENIKFYQLKVPTKENVLDDLVKRELGVQEAKRMGLEKDSEVIDRVNTVLYQALIEKTLAKKFDEIKISDSEAQSFYAKNPEIRTSHIFVAVSQGAPTELEESALKKITDIKNTHLKNTKMSFAEVAQRYSEGMAAPLGGDLDYQTRDRLDPAYYEAAVKLGLGQVSGIIRSQFGYHIIKLTGKHSWNEVDRAKIKRLAYEEKRQKIFDSYMADLRKKSNVKVNYKALK